MKTKLNVTHNGKTFTRSTAHKYTHVVIARLCKASAITRANAAWDKPLEYNKYTRSNFDFHVAEGHLKATHGTTDWNEYLVRARAASLASIEEKDAKGGFEFYASSWHHTEAAARKEAAKAMKWATETIVVPVDGGQ